MNEFTYINESSYYSVTDPNRTIILEYVYIQ